MDTAIVPATARSKAPSAGLATISWPAPLAPLIAEPKVASDGSKVRWRLLPKHLDVEMTPDEIRDAARAMNRALQEPASPKAIAVLITRLFVHYKAIDLSEQESEWLWEDIVDDLAEFPVAAIAAAAREWRQTQKWRPTISEMREVSERQRKLLGQQVDRAAIISGAKCAGWHVVIAMKAEGYITEEHAGGLLYRAWILERERYENICALAKQVPSQSEPYQYDHAGRTAFRAALRELCDAVR